MPWSFVPRTGAPNWAAYGGTAMTGVRKRGMYVYLGLELREPAWLYDGSGRLVINVHVPVPVIDRH